MTSEYIEDGSDVILLTIDNDQPLYNQKISIYRQLTKRKKNKTYNSGKAQKAFLNFTTVIGRKMNKGGYYYDGGRIPTDSYRLAAKEMVARFEDEYKGKEYDFM